MHVVEQTRKSVKLTAVKRNFDPSKKEDLLAYKNFIKSKTWGLGTCPFELEWPYGSIPDMLAYKIANYTVSKL